MRSALILMTVTCVVFASTPAAGQGRDAQIMGQVTDESGAVLPGVTVTLTSPALQVPNMTTVTNEVGEYRFSPLPNGAYLVAFELGGFRPSRREDVRLTQGFTARIDVALGVGTLDETVTVTGAAPLVDVASTSGTTMLTAEVLELTPTSRVGVASLLTLTPGVRTFLDVGGNNMAENANATAFGQTGEIWYTIEGVAMVDATRSFWDQMTLEEARVQTLGTDAEFPTHGVQITGIVKSGGNQFHGGGSVAGTNESFQSNNLNEELEDLGFSLGDSMHRTYDIFGNLGGRIIPNKLWFFGALRRRLLETNVLNTFLPNGDPAFGIVRSTIFTGKVSYQLNASNKFIFFHLNERNYEEKGASELVAYESREAKANKHPTTKIEWEGMRGTFVTHLQYGYNTHDAPQPFINDPPIVPRIDNQTETVTGDSIVLGEYAYRKTHHFTGSGTYYKPNFFKGNHEFKAGFDTTLIRDTRSMLERPINYGLLYNDGVPDQVFFFNSPVTPVESVNLLGIYLKDSWTVGRLLTLNLGVRYAREDLFVNGVCREAAAFPSDIMFPAQCFDDVKAKVFNNIQPRMAMAYDITGDGKTVLKGGWGRYYDQRGGGDALVYDRNSITYAIFGWQDLNNNNDWDLGETDRDPSGNDFVETTAMEFGAVSPRTVPNPDEKQTRFDDFMVSLERELIPNFSVRTTGLISRVRNIRRRANLLRPYEAYNVPITQTDPGPDNVLGNGDDGGPITYFEFDDSLSGAENELYTFINDEGANQQYNSIEIAAIKRFADRWQLTASYSATKRDRGPGLTGDFNPNSEIFTEDHSWDWDSKVTGTYMLPYDISFGGTWHHTSGNQFARQVQFRNPGGTIPTIVLNVEEFGSQRSPNINLVTFRGEKSFRFANAHKVAIQVNLYNALNANTPVVLGVNPSLTNRSGPDYLRPRAIMPPRLIELSAAYSF